jgi:pyruvate/2-oxoglutarate dehydrogenase complex dihydrolipoamide dehydrogenase (E3) component
MPTKARAGERHTVCIGCNQGCIGHYHAGTPIACTINPWTGFERTLTRPRPAEHPQRVVIVGAGPAGCAAAVSAAACGHDVVVFERSGHVGGQMRHALGAPGHAEIAAALVATLEGWVASSDLRTDSPVDADAVMAEEPDRVIVATGAVPYNEPLAGADLPVIQAWDVLDGLDLIGNQIVVADWGGDWTGLAVAEVLAARGHAVRLVTAAAAFGEGIHQYQRNMYLGRLDDVGVELVHHLRPVAVRAGAVEFRNAFSDRAVAMEAVDALVVNGGRSAEAAVFEELEERGADVVRVGDALGPRSFEEAIREGTEAGLAVGTPLAAHTS